MAYDKNTDYSLLIKAAEEAGNTQLAAIYEQQRNEKIADMNKSGTNTGNWAQTNKYQTPTTTPQAAAPTGFAGSATTVGVNTQNQQAWKDEMNANSQAWWTADDATKQQLHERNEYLSSLLGGTVAFDDKTGTWGGDAAAAPILQPSFNFNYSSDARPTFESDYGARIDEMLNQILNRDDFSYDVNSDPLYQQYANMYNREGNRAMNDTLASAAAGAGGMNSYAITAAQQANDYYSAQLGDKIPELYQMAYDMYLKDLDLQVRDLGLLEDMDNTQYNRYRDTMSDWVNDRDFAYNKYRDDMGDYKWQTEFDYGISRDQVADGRYDNEWEYNVGRDEIEDGRYESETAYNKAMQMLQMGTMPDASTLSAAGISTAEATAYMAAVKQQQAAKKTTSSSGGGGGGSTGSGGGGGELDYEGLFAAAQASGNPKSWLAQKANYKQYGFTTSTGLYDDYEAWLENQEEPPQGVVEPTEEEFDVSALGDPAVVNYIEALYSVGAVKMMGNKFAWASGWNKDNYREKLKSATMQNIFTGFGDTP